MRIVHLSPSVLAGAPGMLADAQRDLLGHDAVHFRFGDNGPERDLLSPNTVALSRTDRDREVFIARVREAEVIHVHNFVPTLVMTWLASVPGIRERTWVYQVHSPISERPIFRDLSADHGVHWHARLAVCHVHPRMFPDFRPMPNVLHRPFITPTDTAEPFRGGVLTVVHSPSGRATTRWAAKSDEDFELEADRLRRDPAVRLLTLEGVSPRRVAITRTISHVAIDEVTTGGFHLVSYEGLAAGNVVVNGADRLSLAAFAMGFRTSETPPWVITDTANLHRVLQELAADPDRTAGLMAAGHDYFWRVMAPARVVGFYDEVYRS